MRQLAIALATAACAPNPSGARTDGRTLFLQIDYVQVPEGGDGEFLAAERELYKPIHRERARRGLILEWGLCAVLLAPPDALYNFATVTVYDDSARLAGTYQGVLGAARDMGAPLARTLAVREIVHTELREVVDTAHPAGTDGPAGRYLVRNYMKVPPGGSEA